MNIYISTPNCKETPRFQRAPAAFNFSWGSTCVIFSSTSAVTVYMGKSIGAASKQLKGP